MIQDKQTKTFMHVATGRTGSDLRTSDGIELNTTYTLIYSTDRITNRVASMAFSGGEIAEALGSLMNEFNGDWSEIQAYRRDALSAYLEVWGNAAVFNRSYLKHPAKSIVREVQKAQAGSRKHREEIKFHLALYVATHVNELAESDRYIYVNDVHDMRIPSEQEFLNGATKDCIAKLSYEESVERMKTAGCFKLDYPTKADAQKLLASK